MKKLFFLLILLPFLSTAQSDTTFSKNGSITSINEQGINKLVKKHENTLIAKNGVEIWRVQLVFKAKKEDIKQVIIDFTNRYPKIPTYLEYEEPYYRVRVGNCKTKLEAVRIKQQIKEDFPGAYLCLLYTSPSPRD